MSKAWPHQLGGRLGKAFMEGSCIFSVAIGELRPRLRYTRLAMTERVVIEHKIHCSEKTFWDLFQDDEYNRTIFMEQLQFERWEIVDRKESGDLVERKVEVEPKVGEFPIAVKKAIGEKIAYREEGTLDKSVPAYRFEVFPAVLADKFKVSGQQTTRVLDEKSVIRRFEIEVQVKVFGVGGLVEKAIIKDLRRGYDLGAAYTNDYIAKHGLQ